jgi:peptidoglycan/LPS O-acetylase OafA/YrhL
MKPHRLDPTALIAGLLFALSGAAIVADQTWSGLDTAAVAGAAVATLGVLLLVVLVTRQIRERTSETPDEELTT